MNNLSPVLIQVDFAHEKLADRCHGTIILDQDGIQSWLSQHGKAGYSDYLPCEWLRLSNPDIHGRWATHSATSTPYLQLILMPHGKTGPQQYLNGECLIPVNPVSMIETGNLHGFISLMSATQSLPPGSIYPYVERLCEHAYANRRPEFVRYLLEQGFRPDMETYMTLTSGSPDAIGFLESLVRENQLHASEINPPPQKARARL